MLQSPDQLSEYHDCARYMLLQRAGRAVATGESDRDTA